MIILDAEEEQYPKIASPLPIHAPTNRPETPTPSLPDYETSQEHLRTGKWNKPMSRRLKWTLWGLATYFVVTIAVGVPLIVVKARHAIDSYSLPSMFYPTPFKGNGSSQPIFNLGAFPVCVESASACDVWSIVDSFDGARYNAQLEYYVALVNTIFVQSNVTYARTNSDSVSGLLTVQANPNTSERKVTILVDMSYTGKHIRELTSVCVVNMNGSDGLYLYVPSNLSATDTLYFNISLLLPQSPGPTNLHVANFLTSLPYFTQNISVQPSQASFGNVALGGYKAPLYMDLLEADAILLRNPFAGSSGVFNITKGAKDTDGDDDDT